jgi:hypothetical protein
VDHDHVLSAEEPVVRKMHTGTPVPYLQHCARPHRTPACDRSRLSGQSSRPASHRRLALHSERPWSARHGKAADSE